VTVTRDYALVEAEATIRNAVREHSGRYTPSQLIQQLRTSANLRDDVARVALWYLLDRREILLTSDWRLDAPDSPAL
jgi:hypothetical protein